MERSIILKVILFVSGIIAIGVGGAILIAPVAFHATSGIELGNNISLLNETRAAGGAILAVGLLVISGVFVARLSFTATVVSTVFYLSYAASRLLSIALDGMPSQELLLVGILELTVGLTCAFALGKYRLQSTL
jgi:Domain of unknown function (DUF4345)